MILMFFVHHGRKIAPVLYIYPSTETENNTEVFVRVRKKVRELPVRSSNAKLCRRHNY